MTKAEKASIAYQLVAHGPRVMGGDAVLSDDDLKFWNINYDFVAGYEQAEKDLALTWKDISIICQAYVDVNYEFDYHSLQEKYEEILWRFNKAKEEQK